MLNNIMIMKRLNLLWVCVLMVVLLLSCEETSIPKPRGYLRAEMPEKKYQTFETKDFSFNILDACTYDINKNNESWIKLHYPQLDADILFTYFDKADIYKLSEETRKNALEHLIKADDIQTLPFAIPERQLYGTIYSIEGNTATSTVFQFNDSISQFIHGIVYFNTVPNYDSLKPSIFFIRRDIQNFIETFQWKHLADKN